MNVLLIVKQMETSSLQKHYHKSPYSCSIISVSEVAGSWLNRPPEHILKPIFAQGFTCDCSDALTVCAIDSNSLLYIKSVNFHWKDVCKAIIEFLKQKTLCCCRTMLPYDISLIRYQSFFTLVLFPSAVSAEFASFRIRHHFWFLLGWLVWVFFPNLKWYLLHFFALIMTFPLWFPKQIAGWNRIALICSIGSEQQLSKMWIEKGNAKQAFDLQSYNFKESIQELKILTVGKSLFCVCDPLIFKARETIRPNTRKIKGPRVSASIPHLLVRPNNIFKKNRQFYLDLCKTTPAIYWL